MFFKLMQAGSIRIWGDLGRLQLWGGPTFLQPCRVASSTQVCLISASSLFMLPAFHRYEGSPDMRDRASVPQALQRAHAQLGTDNRRLYIRSESQQVFDSGTL